MDIIDLTLKMHDGFCTLGHLPRTIVLEHSDYSASRYRFSLPCEGNMTKTLILSDHAGTHVDAPVDFCKGAADVAEIPLERLMGDGILCDASLRPPGTPVLTRDLEDALGKVALEPKDKVILVRCSREAWGEGGFFQTKGLSGDAARFLLSLKPRCVGVDLPVVDDIEDRAFPAHMTLLGAGIPVVESLVNLGILGQEPFIFIGLPLRIQGLTGSPLRAVAVRELTEKKGSVIG
ncbi:MAG: cyclase family protein [Bacillota bacterium]